MCKSICCLYTESVCCTYVSCVGKHTAYMWGCMCGRTMCISMVVDLEKTQPHVGLSGICMMAYITFIIRYICEGILSICEVMS